LQDLNGKRIATSYPKSLQRFLTQEGISASVHTISGSVEIAPNIDLADAICDLVSTGSTLFQNGLKEVQTILYSQAALFSRLDLSLEKKEILQNLLTRIRSVLEARSSKYILMYVPSEEGDEMVTQYGATCFTSVLQRDQFYGCQFHPEKSGKAGLQILQNFLKL